MDRILVSALAGLLSIASLPAVAADLAVKPAPVLKAAPVSPAPNWNGWYVGGHVGYLWGKTTVWEDDVLIEEDAPTNGFVGGILTGFNWQSGAWVFSLEGDFGWTNAHGTGVAAPVVVNHYDF